MPMHAATGASDHAADTPASGPPGLKLSVARYRLTAVFDRELTLPAFSGPLLRSVFGLALRRGVCTTGAADCTGCPVLSQCAYPALFETPARATQLRAQASQVPNPYVMEPPPMGSTYVPAGQPLTWHQVLMGGQALAKLPLVVSAWERALHSGWGRERIRGRLLDLAHVDAQGNATSVRQATGLRLLPHDTLLSLAPDRLRAAPSAVTLHFDTPCRLQHDGRPLRPAELTPRKLAADLLRRCNQVLEIHLGLRPAPFDAPALVAMAQTLQEDRSRLRWHDEARYSARQRQETPVGGVVGPWTLSGNLDALMPWLRLGQWLHLGKGATMGLGAYRLEELR